MDISAKVKPWELLKKALPHSDVKNFSFNVPMEIVKGRVMQKGQRPIRGVASTPHQDLQKEDVIQKGLDTTYFVRHGYYNDDHQKGHKHKVGQPTLAVVKSTEDRYGNKTTGLWTEGFLWKKGLHNGADAIVELAKSLEVSGADRQMGFSIEGKVLQRDGSQIIKAWVQDIAITSSPINTYTWMELIDDFRKSIWCSDKQVQDLKKSISSPQYFAKSDLIEGDHWSSNEEAEEEKKLKALVAASALVPQSLEQDLKIPTAGLEKSVSASLKAAYCVARSRGWSATKSRQIALATIMQSIL